MTLLNTRRVAKSLLKVGMTKPKFSVALANTEVLIENRLETIAVTQFNSFEAASIYLRNKDIKFLVPPIYVGGNYSYRLTNKQLTIRFDFSAIREQFNTLVVLMEAAGKTYIFDIKDIDVNDLFESDGFEYTYHI
jgi:hypothetical protein